jgi:hypothetical protein
LAALPPIFTVLETREGDADRIAKEVRAALSVQAPLDFYCGDDCPFEAFHLGAEVRALRERSSRHGGGLTGELDAVLRFLRDHAEDVETIRKRSGTDKDVLVVLRLVQALRPTSTGSEPLSGVPALMSSAGSGDRAEFGSTALRVALAGVLDEVNAESPPTELDRLYAAFIINFVSYVLRDNGTSNEAVRDGFRVSAARLLDGLSSSDGYLRRGFVIRPTAALRFSWNAGYLSATSGDGFRYVASVDWPAWRYSFGANVALQISMLDLVAPLAELALRKPADYNNQALVLLDIVRPRLTMFLGIPQLTKNVVVSVGISARLLAVCGGLPKGVEISNRCDAPRDPGPGGRLKYLTTFTNNPANNQIPEVNLGLAYVF